MSAVNDGGPAFPILERGGQGLELSSVGMSLRDYFATKGIDPGIRELTAKGDLGPETLARFCFRFADAMLKAREQKGGAA